MRLLVTGVEPDVYKRQNWFCRLARIGSPEQTATKIVITGASIRALTCLNASRPNKTIAINKIQI